MYMMRYQPRKRRSAAAAYTRTHTHTHTHTLRERHIYICIAMYIYILKCIYKYDQSASKEQIRGGGRIVPRPPQRVGRLDTETKRMLSFYYLGVRDQKGARKVEP